MLNIHEPFPFLVWFRDSFDDFNQKRLFAHTRAYLKTLFCALTCIRSIQADAVFILQRSGRTQDDLLKGTILVTWA